MTLLEQLKMVSATYGSARNLKPSSVSRLAFGDGQRLPLINSGDADVTTKRYERALLWFSEHWPADAAWPETVKRPQPEAIAS